ncbi:hypothetical protein HKK52_15740 [Pseudomonas sp. ADAK2]|uniref:hypothetical protein n=1 Tax=Pseudomonas TaxID=286 RepID=UPI0014634ACA|nr:MULTISPECIES: hypothetical protein [unclassified Pseudomonas]QJI42327.1 hypothetical protein HKK53_15745 [Pseudomonas sp. ADAK7]QJI48630.1 hypothetical protein HKK52_15740 [Pseudomonas sp. ADAK2]
MSKTFRHIDPQDLKKAEPADGELTAQVAGEEEFVATAVYHAASWIVGNKEDSPKNSFVALSYPDTAEEGLNKFTYNKGSLMYPVVWEFNLNGVSRDAETGTLNITINSPLKQYSGHFTFVLDDGKELKGNFNFIKR